MIIAWFLTRHPSDCIRLFECPILKKDLKFELTRLRMTDVARRNRQERDVNPVSCTASDVA